MQPSLDQTLQEAFQHHQAGRLSQAEAQYRAVLAAAPNHVGAMNMLGVLYAQVGRFAQAEQMVQQALSHTPNDANAYSNLGQILHAQGRLNDAINSYQRALSLNPNLAPAHNNLGNVFHQQGHHAEALAEYERAIKSNPQYAEAYNNLGNALNALAEFDRAIDAYRHAVALNHHYADAFGNLGASLLSLGRQAEAITYMQQALKISPRAAGLHSDLLLAIHYDPANGAESIFHAHQQWAKIHAEPLAREIKPLTNDRTADRVLRVGYLSQDFRYHSVAHFALPLIQAHDRSQVHVTGYFNSRQHDAVTDRFVQAADDWREIANFNDEDAAELIRKDRIDILVDLSGHTASNRLLIFARKPAPIAVTYLGYPDTTGMGSVDYRFTDAIADPPDMTDRWCVEKLVRLPQTAWCFRPLSQCPPILPLPAIANGFVTFGSFNYRAKLSELMLGWWSEILKQVPGARLLIKNRSMASQSAQQAIRNFFSQRGIADQRIELAAWEPDPQNLYSWYQRVDLALDSYPYHGTTTTCEATYMAVPTITLIGRTHVSRVSASLLTTVGLGALVTDSPEEYVQRAVELANDLPRLTELHASLRQRMEASPLMDAPAFARNVEAAYRTMWQQWCASNS